MRKNIGIFYNHCKYCKEELEINSFHYHVEHCKLNPNHIVETNKSG